MKGLGLGIDQADGMRFGPELGVGDAAHVGVGRRRSHG